MLSRIEPHLRIPAGALVIIVLSIIVLIAGLSTAASRRRQVRQLHGQIEKLQERLISAQITTSRLDQVQELINKNLAWSRGDTLTRGASLPFLRALTAVLDELEIVLTSMQPLAPRFEGRFVETPYRITIKCTYRQLCELVNKMEKSPRLISIQEYAITNELDEYFNDTRKTREQCPVSMTLTTLTLVRE